MTERTTPPPVVIPSTVPTLPNLQSPLSLIEKLAIEQNVKPVNRLEDLKAEFWPEDESAADIVDSIRQLRDNQSVSQFRC